MKKNLKTWHIIVKAEQFIENKNIIAYVIGGIALVILGIWGYNHFISSQSSKASEEMFVRNLLRNGFTV